MSFTLASEITLVNQSLDRIAEKTITISDTSSVQYLTLNRHYTSTLNALRRSFLWPFLKKRATLYQVKTLQLDSQPGTAFSADDTLTGIPSGVTATVYSVTSDTEYVLTHLTDDFEDGDTITNGTVYNVCWQGRKVESDDDEVVWFDKTTATMTVSDVTLTVLAPNHEYSYQYQLPSDYITLCKIYEDDGTDDLDDRWEMEGKRILTNYDELHIQYISNSITDPDDFDDLFYQILVLQLCLKIIPALPGTKSKQMSDEIKDELKPLINTAKLISLQEINTSQRSDWNLARFKG